MLGFGWLALRQAQDALTGGRLEEARRLLQQPAAQGHRRHGEQLRQLARAFVDRGERHLRRDDPEAAWADLLQAEDLQTGERSTERLREALARLGVAEVRALLEAGDPRRATRVIGQLRERSVRSAELQMLEETTKSWLTAEELADQGDFARALDTVDRMQTMLLGPSGRLEQLRQGLAERQRHFGDHLVRLHEAADAARWRDALEAAEQVLTLAPQHAEARKARARAWKAIEPVTVAMRPAAEPEPSTQPGHRDESPQRFFLWIDGVGGYLVCLGPTLTLGQSLPDARVDIPLVADVSKLHAVLTRDSEGGYLLEATRPVLVNGQAVTRALLRPDDRITLGATCQLLFRKPVPVSSSARLDLVSGHRLLPGVDSVLLLGDTLVLGSGGQSHVTVPELKVPVVLFRHKDGLGVRHAGSFNVNGERVEGKTALAEEALIAGDTFSFALEPARTRPGRR